MVTLKSQIPEVMPNLHVSTNLEHLPPEKGYCTYVKPDNRASRKRIYKYLSEYKNRDFSCVGADKPLPECSLGLILPLIFYHG